MLLVYNNKIISNNDRLISTVQIPIILPFGSFSLSGTSTSFLTIANDIDLRFETGDFTVEWFQRQTDNNPFPRVFQMGSFPSASFGVSIESGIFYLWVNGSAFSFGSVGLFKNTWTHFAVTRKSNIVRVFKNGVRIGNLTTISSNINNSTNNLTIGNELIKSTSAAFGGQITNFHWVKGIAKYDNNFTPPTSNITPISDSKLLLLANTQLTLNNDSSGLNKIIANNNVGWSSLTPF